MGEICISSDVTSNHILVDLKKLTDLNEELKLDSLSYKWFLTFDKRQLFVICEIITARIDEQIKGRRDLPEIRTVFLNGKERLFKITSIVKMLYKENFISLDIRNENDSYLSFLIGIYDLINTTIKYEGILFLFDRENVERHNGIRIISHLRVKFSLTQAGILENLRELLPGQDFFELQKIVSDNLLALIELGILYFDNIFNDYRLTGRGYLLW